jgi:TrkA-N domain/NADP oxidoreductase coenzyme F420-dependent
MVTDPSSGRDDGRWLIWTLLVAAAAFVLGVIGLAIYLPGEQRFLDLVYHSLQLFVLSSDPLQGNSPYNPPLEVARFLAPATTVYTVFRAFRSVLREGLRRRAVARLVGHTVVTGGGAASLVLAGNLRASGARVVLVGSEAAEVAQRQGILVVPGDAREITTLRAAGVRGASALYACGSQTATNAAVVLAAAEIDGRDRRLEAFAEVRSDELVEALRARQVAAIAHGRRVTLDFFSLEDTAARQLLDRYPPTAASVVIVGFGAFGQALLRALVRRTHPEGRALSITVQTDDADRVVELVAQLEQMPGRTIQSRPSQAADAVKAGDAAFVCVEDEDAALRSALRLARTVDGRVVLCLQRESPFGQALMETPGLDIFGILDAACTPGHITADAVIGKVARAIHNRYVESCRQRGDTELTNPSMRPWAELPLHLRESNYAQAEHIGVKLDAIDCTLVPARVEAVAFEFRPGEVDRLARMEHLRWMAERHAAGYVYGPVRDGNHHPDLVDWPNLSAESQAKDINAVEQLPDLLAATGLQIQRRRI